MDLDELPEQVAIVTGAGRGIGRAIACALSRAGASVALVARSERELAETAAMGERMLALPGDVREVATTKRIVEQTERELGPVSLLVNNAGTAGPAGPDWRVDPDDWWECVESAVRGSFLCSQAVLPLMIDRQAGRIVNLASITGTQPFPFLSATSVAKTAILRLTEGLAISVAPYGVRAFAIHPGVIDTEITRSYVDSPLGREWMSETVDWVKSVWQTPEDAGTTELVLRLAAGRFDRLSGRLLTAGADPDQLDSMADELVARDALVLRLHD